MDKSTASELKQKQEEKQQLEEQDQQEEEVQLMVDDAEYGDSDTSMSEESMYDLLDFHTNVF